ncbi:hypothetical protein pb186bvf_015497 [Paramecium bursaria]
MIKDNKAQLTNKYYIKKERSLQSLRKNTISSNESSQSRTSLIKQIQQKIQYKDEHISFHKQIDLKNLFRRMSSQKKKTIKVLDMTEINKNRTNRSPPKIFIPQIEDPFFRELKKLHQNIFKQQISHFFYLRPSQIKQQSYFIENGNIILKQLMIQRWWWQQGTDDNQFMWTNQLNTEFIIKQRTRIIDSSDQQIKDYLNLQIEYVDDHMQFAISNRLVMLPQYQKLHNHIQGSHQLYDKKLMIKNLIKYYHLVYKDPFQFIPFSILVCSVMDPQFVNFNRKYKGSQELWIVKQVDHVCQNSKICASSQQVTDYIISQFQIPNKNQQQFIIQKYIKSSLYYKRKFDIRCFILVSQINSVIKLYFYKEGYGRTTGYDFIMNDTNPFIHMTTDALQKQAPTYGLYEESNKISFNELEKYFGQFNQDFQQILNRMQNLALDAFRSSFRHLIIKDHNFEIFGVDFIIDSQFKPWLIDINNTPLEGNCQVLKNIIPQMLDDSLSLTIDLLYPPPIIWPINKRKYFKYKENQFQIGCIRIDQFIQMMFNNLTIKILIDYFLVNQKNKQQIYLY